MLSVFLYLFGFIWSSCLLAVLQKIKVSNNYLLCRAKNRSLRNIFFFLLSMLPVIVLYAFRDGIGADFYWYQKDYAVLHHTPVMEYIAKHFEGDVRYYYELGYYLLNKIAMNFIILQILCIILCLGITFHAVYKYRGRLRIEESVMIFLLLNFVYLMNGVRYIISLSFLLLAYSELAERKWVRFIVLIFCAGFFHKTALFCLFFIVLVDLKNVQWNKIRNMIMVVATILLPVLFPAMFAILGKIPVFSRYVTREVYALTQLSDIGGLKWTIHFIPVFAPIVMLQKTVALDKDVKFFKRVAYMEIPLRIVAMYNPWYGRLTRLAQVSQVILIPCFLHKVSNRKNRAILTVYYAVWYVFYFIYYTVFIDGSSIPYVSIFFK